MSQSKKCHVHEFFFFSRPSGPSKALKLGAKGKEVDNFVDKLKSEGENIILSSSGKRSSEAAKVLPPPVNMERYATLSLAPARSRGRRLPGMSACREIALGSAHYQLTSHSDLEWDENQLVSYTAPCTIC